MADHKEPKKTDDPEAVARRAFLKKVGTVGATAPAAALLLAASNKKASAQIYGGCDTCECITFCSCITPPP